MLGEGTYGMVFKAVDRSDPSKVVAIKRIYKKSLVTEELEFQQYEANVLKVI
jgi:serine/threonine protein kinase